MELSVKQRKPSVYGGWLSFAGPTKYPSFVLSVAYFNYAAQL
jgi:hypothetical protein